MSLLSESEQEIFDRVDYIAEQEVAFQRSLVARHRGKAIEMVAGVTLEPGRPTHFAALQRDNLLQELAEQKLAIAEESVLLATSEAYDLSIGEDPKSADVARAFAQSTSLPSVRTEPAESGSTVDASCIGFDVCVNRLASPNRPFK